MDGILVIDKPAGPTSHDVVAKVRKLLNEKKVGHTGTLDPVATGVLPLVLGRATKVARYVAGGDKTYRAVVRLGIVTDTLDADGAMLEERPVEVTREQVREELDRFLGEIEQIPPMFSAKKVQGKRLYELARRGVEVEREPKKVRVHSIDLVAFEPPRITIEVRCSAGTYLRVLAHDLGERLGCGAHLGELRRLAAGGFSIEDAVELGALEEDPARAAEYVLPLGRALGELPRIEVPEHIGTMVASGYQLTAGDLRSLDTPGFEADAVVALWLDDGRLLALARALFASAELEASRRDRQALKTERVLSDVRRSRQPRVSPAADEPR